MSSNIDVRFIPAKHWWLRPKWQLLAEYISADEQTIVPMGFITDGASVPGFFKMIFAATGQYFGAAIIHDYLLAPINGVTPDSLQWKKANNAFKRELLALNIIPWRVWALYNAVNIWGHVKVKIVNPIIKFFKKLCKSTG